jgi:isopenicillin N synthase-like dioxygenase
MAAENVIPTIDLSPLRNGSETEKREVARQIDAACMQVGFFVAVGHGIHENLIETTRQRAVDFFALPDKEKKKVRRPPTKISRGYNWVGDRSLSYSVGQATPPDIQEAFAFGPDFVPGHASRINKASAQMYAANVWPDRPNDFKQVMLCYYDAVSVLASHVLRAMAMALGVKEAYFADKFDRQASVVRIIRYPAVTRPPLPGQLRAGVHTDFGIMTFVRGDDTPGGLQVKLRHGDWIDVHTPHNAFVCNIGDLMMRWSNDRWIATLHRVALPPPGSVPVDRFSLVFFYNPNPDTIIRCLESCVGPGEKEKYPPIMAAEHYLGKLMKTSHSRLDAKVDDALTNSERRKGI